VCGEDGGRRGRGENENKGINKERLRAAHDLILDLTYRF
jgi:hypothetical protein